MIRRLAQLLLLAAALAAVAFGVRLGRYLYAPIPVDAPTVRIPKGAGLDQVVRILAEVRVAPWKAGTMWGFRLRGRPGKIKAGVYAFRKGYRLVHVLRDLEEGRVDRVRVTFPEGSTVRDMAAILQAADVTRAADFTSLCLDPRSAARAGVPGPTLEGYLFPDTYLFARELPARAVADALVRRFRQVTGELVTKSGGKGQEPDLLHWVTLASVVEKETGRPEERPLIAAVFRNRLDRDMPLQSDPTVIYGIASFNGNLTRADLRRDSPYNTYVRKGLPPGPIANPGRASLEAALHPAPAGFLYFVSRNDGYHAFSVDYGDHVRAVNRYQRRPAR
ncbi:MAG: endolytic transglycosylase MltG [Deltaproteobacteria bacterium]|nr:endolytic transglycosylase MltG [Deltaproteobacteria bacterium]